MDYPVESFTEAERERLRPHFTNLDRPVFALVNLPETVKAALFARYSRYPGTLRRLFLEEFADDLPARRRPRRARRGPAGGAALRADLPRLRRRFGGAAGWRPRGLRVGLEHPDQGAPAPPPGRLPRAVDSLHRLRRADARPARRLPLLPRRRRSGREYERGDGRAVRDLLAARCRAVCAWAETEFPRAGDEPAAAHARAIKAKALDLLRGLLPASSLSPHGHLRHRPDLRAADPPPARPPAARGARRTAG